MAIRDVIGAALALKESYDQLEALQASKATYIAYRDDVQRQIDAVQAQIDATQLVVDERKAALKTAAATL